MTHNEAVWNGACGISPFGKGTPKSPAIPVVRPRRKKSQSSVRNGRYVRYGKRQVSSTGIHCLGKLMTNTISIAGIAYRTEILWSM